MFRILVFLGALAFASTAAGQGGDVRVKTKSGVMVGSSNNGVSIFKGVPYAKPPLGDLRWRPPQPITWQGQLQAKEFKLPCLQITPANGAPNGGGVAGPTSEDCLYLNVWAPANARNAPVMLWLHGGAGHLGAGSLESYHGLEFARQGVIVVTINYRLGMLGQFAHPALTRAAGGREPLANYQLMDAVAALRWVKDNGRALGGDTSNVTLFGQSAGAVMVAALLATPPAKGLFHKAIIQSAVPQLGNNRSLIQAEADGVKFATTLGLPGAEATPEQLRALPAERVISAEARSAGFTNGSYLVLDGKVRPMTVGNGFITGATVDVPLIVGSNSAEFFGLEASRMVGLASIHGRAPAWQYYFDYVPEWRRGEQPQGAPHSAELTYVFNTFRTSSRRGGGSRTTAADDAVVRTMHSCWVAFAKAPPTAKDITCADGFVWPAYNPGLDNMAVFRATPAIQRALPIIAKSAAEFPMRPDIGEP